MKRTPVTQFAGLALAGAAFSLAPSAYADDEPWVRISEIRIMQPGFDADEYFEIEGTPGYSLDGYWYLVLGDHSNFNNPETSPPDYRSGVVEFAMDLTGYTIPESGFFLVVPDTFSLIPLSGVLAGGGEVIANLEFENNDNVTHILVRGYQGREVLQMADQYGALAVDLDPDNDGTLIDPLPWDETVDAIGLTQVLNEFVNISGGDEFVYGAALGFEDIGPDRGTFVPAHVFRGANDGRWNIGIYSLDGGTDTPGAPNLNSPVEPIIEGFSPRTVEPGGSFTITGGNLSTTKSVLVGGLSAAFEVFGDDVLNVKVGLSSTGGVITIVNNAETTETTATLRVLSESRSFVNYEDFEADLGEFLVVSLASNRNWEYRRFGENGFAQMSGFGADVASDDWLISPAIDLSGAREVIFEFVTARNFSGPDLEVLISSNYTGANPQSATWTALGGELSTSGYEIVSSGPVSLSEWEGETVHIAFRYTSEGPESGQGATIQVHDFLITKSFGFEPDWVDHPNLGASYLLSPSWAYHEMVNYVYVALYPWIFHPDFGWLYHIGGHPESPAGAWLYSQALGHLWSRADLAGTFYYEDGTSDNFFLGFE